MIGPIWTLLIVTALLLAHACAVAQEDDGWYEFKPTSENGPSVIGMEGWLDGPAGSHGPVLMRGQDLVFQDGRRVKFWGVNLGGSDCTPSREQADYWAERFARYGINCVRFHKPWDDLYRDDDSTALDPEALARFDYFCNALRQRGIYYSWSFFYHHRLRGKDFDKLWFAEDLKAADQLNVYGITDYLPDVQDILIEATVNLLEHTNPHTGLTYAEDPALVCVEFQNEASAMFWHGYKMPNLPNYQRYLSRKFSRWLLARYTSQEALVAAWGERAMDAFEYKNENLADGTILCYTASQEMAPGGLEEAAKKGLKRRLIDNAEFLHEVQNEFYGRFADIVRNTGYVGPLVGSCWRGQGGITEYYNLRSDWLVGIIDRHNYHGGLSGWKPRAEAFGNAAQVNEPGGGLFSSGMVQMIDRPYAFSEWASVFPNEWTLESPAIIAVYGLGLQDWDASYQFATRTKGRGYSDALHNGNLLWNIERPENIGIYPNLARMIYRGDVQPGEVISVRRVSMTDLRKGELPFENEYYSGRQDVKKYHGPMPGDALAAGRVVVEFVPEPADSSFPDMSRYRADGVITSGTGQLRWDVSRPDRGFFTVNTPGTRAVVGFAPDEPQKLGSVTIALRDTPFAGVFVTSLSRERGIDEAAESLLLTAMARTRNTGMRFNEKRDELLALGSAPILVEPVVADIHIDGPEIIAVRVLDHDGRRTDRTVPEEDNKFTIDGRRDKTMYYEIILAPSPK